VAAREEALRAGAQRGPRGSAPGARREFWTALAVAVGAAAGLALRLDVPAFFDNEGRYAAVAREMVVRGDWLSPHLDGTLFLNKPPLTFWLAAVVFRIAGPTEWARLASIAGAAVTLFATGRLAGALFGARTVLPAGLALATTLGFALEARTLRPDMLVVAAVTVSLLCWWRAGASGAPRVRWLVGMYAALGAGVLAKGLVPVALAAVPIGVLELRAHGWRGLARVRPGLGLVVVAAVVLPWHVAMALRHPGFAWDYVVNQHLLFFLDRKLPRDSEGDPLAFFWTAFVARALPWSLVAPMTLGAALRGLRAVATPEARATAFCWLWLGGVLVLFSLAPSRLEHYALPALPAVALLAARVWQRLRAEGLAGVPRAWLALVGVVAIVAGLVLVVRGPALLGTTYWIAQAPGLLPLAAPAGATLVAVGGVVAGAALLGRPALAWAALAAGTVPLAAIVLTAEARAEALFSWRPVARALAARVAADGEVVFEAPEEYQLVGGLAYYTGRHVTLLAVPGFVPPTYLADHMRGMFLDRDAFGRRWQAGERLAFVSDPQRRRDDPAGLVPGPYVVVGRFGDRWVLATPSAAR
jgi:4-amino-4-deoxy-L-arabinose transferase-like glycosyltransferase